MTYFSRLPVVQFLLIDDDVNWIQAFRSSFYNARRQFEIIHKLDALEIKSVDNHLAADTRDGKITNPGPCAIDWLKTSSMTGDCQGILLDWELQSSNEKGELIEIIKSIRPELPIYIITQYQNGYDIINSCPHSIDDFFYKPHIETDIVDIIKRLLGHFEKRRNMPFWEAYKDYIYKSNDTWHTPGHFGGVSFRTSKYVSDFYDYFGDNTFKGDLSVSVDKLGSLLDSTEYIAKAQDKAAEVFGAKHTFFVTNGSSTANKIIIQTILRPGDKVIVDRNCHKSVHYGIIQSGAMPYYLDSEYNQHLGIFAPPQIVNIETAIKESRGDVKLLILTGCTYEGILSDIRSIVRLCHAHGVKVMIDEAWFAYSRFHPDYVQFSAVEAGADYVTHSSHKVLSAFSQASMIHINDPDFDDPDNDIRDFFREIFYIYTSTSPQYQIIASLDIAAHQMMLEGFKLISESRRIAENFRTELSQKLSYFKVVNKEAMTQAFSHLSHEQVGFDILKVLIDFSETGLSAKELLGEIRDRALLEIEKSTHSTFLVLFTIGTKADKANRLYMVLQQIDERIRYKGKVSSIGHTRLTLPAGISLKESTTPANIFFGRRTKIPVKHALNRISAGLVTPYPPGIPLLVPAQIISQAHIDHIIKVLIPGDIEVHGLFDGYIYVEEEAGI